MHVRLIEAHLVFYRRRFALCSDGFILGIDAALEEIVIWEQIVLELAQPYDIFVRDEASRAPLFHVLNFCGLAHVFLVLNDFPYVMESWFVTIGVLLANVIIFLGELLRSLPNAGDVAHSLVPFFLLSRDLIDLLELLGGMAFQLFKPEWIQHKQLVVERLDLNRVRQGLRLDDVRVWRDHAKQVALLSDHSHCTLL